MDRFGKFFLIALTGFTMYAVAVGTFVPKGTEFGKFDPALLPFGFMLAVAGITGAVANDAINKKRTHWVVTFWMICALTLGVGLFGWVIYATSPFIAFGFIPIIVVSFLVTYLWNIPLVQTKSQRS